MNKMGCAAAMQVGLVTLLYVHCATARNALHNDALPVCQYITVGGVVHNPAVLGDYHTTSLTCSNRHVYKQIESYHENYIYYFDSDLEPDHDKYHVNVEKPSTHNSLHLAEYLKHGENGVLSKNDISGKTYDDYFRTWHIHDNDDDDDDDDDDEEEEEKSEEREESSSSELYINVKTNIKPITNATVGRNTTSSISKEVVTDEVRKGKSAVEDEKEEDVRMRRQATGGKTSQWQDQLSGWRIGPVSCLPDTATVMNLEDNPHPSTITQAWMEYLEYKWEQNDKLILTCKDPPHHHDTGWQFMTRQKLGFTIVICLACVCILHSLWQNYKRQRRAFHLQDPQLRDLEASSDGPPNRSRNHFVILSFPRDASSSRISRSSRNRDLLVDDDCEEEDADDDPQSDFVHTGLVQPPGYEEVAVNGVDAVASPEGAPPSYEEAVHDGRLDATRDVNNNADGAVGGQDEEGQETDK